MLYIQDQLDFLLYERGTSITVNGIPTTAIMEFKSTIDIEEVDLITSTLIKRGDLICIEGRNYLIDQEINIIHFGAYYKAIAMSCNYNIKFIINNVPVSYNCIVSSKTFDITTDKMLMLPVGKIVVLLPFNNNTNTIKLQDRFIKMGNPWKISGVDKTRSGLVVITADYDSIIQGDDMANEVVYYTGNSTHIYVVTSTPTSPSIVIGATQQLVSSVTDKGVLVSNSTFTYSSLSPSIATVSTNGLITGVSLGTATIVVSFLGLDGVTYSKSVTSTITNAVARTFTLVGSSSLSLNVPLVNQTYTVIDGATGLAVTDLAFIYTLSNASLVTIVSSTSNTVTLKGVASGQEKLSAINSTYAPFKIVNVASGF